MRCVALRLALARHVASATQHTVPGHAPLSRGLQNRAGSSVVPPATISALRLDPPCTPIADEGRAVASGRPFKYHCAACLAPVFSQRHRQAMPEAQQGSVASGGWPTFVDHEDQAIALHSVLTANMTQQPSAASTDIDKGPIRSTATGRPVKRSLVLSGVSATQLDVTTVSRGETKENRASMRTDVARRKPASRGRGRRQARLLRSTASAASAKLLEDRRKIVQTHIQGHCAACENPLCLVVMPSKQHGAVRLVGNPSALIAVVQ